TTGNPDNHAARLKLARALAANGAYDEALEAAIEVVRRDRHYNGEEAQKLLLEFFRFLEAYPEHDGLIRRYRRLLSALLH
ncbi:MAG: tetratricopeptide repeat protein, partial [Zoogloeaceae bacterium]|nr:tetratricopeptide repeat protein [Zoogloeaceae bacterium]